MTEYNEKNRYEFFRTDQNQLEYKRMKFSSGTLAARHEHNNEIVNEERFIIIKEGECGQEKGSKMRYPSFNRKPSQSINLFCHYYSLM